MYYMGKPVTKTLAYTKLDTKKTMQIARRFEMPEGLLTVYEECVGHYIVDLDGDMIDEVERIDRDLGHVQVVHYKPTSSKRTYYRTLQQAAEGSLVNFMKEQRKAARKGCVC